MLLVFVLRGEFHWWPRVFCPQLLEIFAIIISSSVMCIFAVFGDAIPATYLALDKCVFGQPPSLLCGCGNRSLGTWASHVTAITFGDYFLWCGVQFRFVFWYSFCTKISACLFVYLLRRKTKQTKETETETETTTTTINFLFKLPLRDQISFHYYLYGFIFLFLLLVVVFGVIHSF